MFLWGSVDTITHAFLDCKNTVVFWERIINMVIAGKIRNTQLFINVCQKVYLKKKTENRNYTETAIIIHISLNKVLQKNVQKDFRRKIAK